MHVSAGVRPGRLTRILALTAGLSWIVKLFLMWENGGTDRFGGTVGLMFMIGTVLLAAAAVVWTWQATRGRAVLIRAGLLLGVLTVLMLAINLPIFVGQTLVPGHWVAEEFGVILVAIVVVIGACVTGPRPVTRQVRDLRHSRS